MQNIDLQFIESKIIDRDSANYNCRSGYGNIEIIAHNIVSFTEYNFLNGGDTNTKFDGHYSFYVNVNTFAYVVLKYADYGGFTWVDEIPQDKQNWFIPHPNIKASIESLIADKLKGAYFYDSTHVNQKGKNLFYSDVKDNYNNYPGPKTSLLCDNRGYNPENKQGELGYITSLQQAIIKLLQDPKAYSLFELKETEKNQNIIPNPYIRSAWRMQYRALYATLIHTNNWLLSKDFAKFKSNPLKQHINNLELVETNKRNIKLKLRMEIKTKGHIFKLHSLYLGANADRCIYIITKNDIVIYLKDSSTFAEASSAFHTLTEVYSNGYNENGSWVYAGLNDAVITDYLWDDSPRNIDYVKVTDVQTHIDKLYCHF